MFAVGQLLTGFGPPALIESDQVKAPLFAEQVGLVRRAIAPEVSARSVAIIDGATGKLVYGKDAHQRLPPASLTKIVTAIVALENARLSDLVKVKVNSVAMPGSSVMGLRSGEELTLEDLLYGLMLPSGNDAAVDIAQYVGGSEERFVQMMNAKVAELGLQDTHFVNPHGLDAEGHYSSAYDMAMLGRYAMRNPVFAKIVGTKEITVRGKWVYWLKNTNALLWKYAGTDGVKTGDEEAAGQTLVASVTRAGHQVFVGLMHSKDRVADAQSLLNYLFANFTWVELALPRNPFFGMEDAEQVWHPFVLQDKYEECLGTWQRSFLNWFVDFSPGAGSGVARFYLDDSLVAKLPFRIR